MERYLRLAASETTAKYRSNTFTLLCKLAGKLKDLAGLPTIGPVHSAQERTWRYKMKKFLILSLMLGTMAFVIPSVEAKTSSPAITAPQVRIQIGRNRRNRRWNRQRRVVTTTRIAQVGRTRYRETIRTTYWPNGRTTAQVINRTRAY